ncbi:BCL2/adenovirus E1B 19 kDa protein-interacting protein 2-like isoform X6 [Dunckerocampus dactyliophorus]|uniref:BCL2/adenovirus E1B 19 kDa protein-interacting protein 2-like isoform X6 n=1 Tax=Dunckerocampus dactyliophorus TaxID=161453 RepID=UPI00240746D8|nr:BCL2/adenovirus E1B 19 kDa protein-interacting protein 2-like isoform X6 [Dunckerocampus dactyliophorus]
MSAVTATSSTATEVMKECDDNHRHVLVAQYKTFHTLTKQAYETPPGDSVALPTPSCSPATTCLSESEEDSSSRGCRVATATRDADSAEEEEREEEKEEEDTGGEVEEEVSSKAAAERPSTLPLTASCGVKKKKVLAAPPLSVSLGRSESGDFHSAFLSLSPGDQDDGLDGGLDFDLDAMETPSDSESLRFPADDLDLEEDTRGGGVAASSRTGSLPDSEQGGLGALEREDMVDSQGTRWRSFSAGEPPQESRVNMSVLEPFLRVLSHGGYYGDGMNDIIVFSSCYLPENSLENYQYVMDNLFRYLVGTLDLMVTENYVIVYLCAGGQKDKLPGIGWLKECYQTIAWRLRKNLKGMYVVHPTWSIKTLITIIKPFISSKFSRKLRFISSLQELAALLPTEHVQIPDCVRLYDRSLSS